MKQTAAEKRTAELTRGHEMYRSHGQDECENDAFMAMAGHPFAEQYLELRAYFDSLKYACNSSARLIAYQNRRHRAEYWAPKLRVSWDGIYPAHDGWEARIEELAGKGWPEECMPSMDPGSVIVSTKSRRIMAELFVITGFPPDIERSEGKEGVYHWHQTPKDLKDTKRVLAVIQQSMGRWMLPWRTPADDEADHTPLPLEEKELTYGYVDSVVVGLDTVTVPQIPLDGTGNGVISRTINELLTLVDQGYPWVKVREYCERWVKPKWLREQDREQKRKAKERERAAARGDT